MSTQDKLLYGFCLGTIFAGLDVLLSWSHTSKLVGFILVFVPSLVLYMHYTKHHNSIYLSKINIFRSCLGFLLIFIDIVYNFFTGDFFGNYDYVIISIGFIIVLLNMNLIQFLKLDDEMTSFLTYFLLFFISIDAFFFIGLNFIFGTSINPLFILMIHASGRVSTFFLNFIEPTTIIYVNEGTYLNFNGYVLNLGTACSGVQSISVFLSAILGYFIASEFRIKKICIYTIAGVCILFFINVVRIMILVMTGYYISGEALLFVHTHLGWILFALAMTVFWYLVTTETE